MKPSNSVFVKVLFLCIVVFTAYSTIKTESYSRSWNFESGDALKIEITPTLSFFHTNTNYSFTIILSPLSFAINQTEFSNITIQIELNTKYRSIFSQEIGPLKIDNLGSSITKITTLTIPGASVLN